MKFVRFTGTTPLNSYLTNYEEYMAFDDDVSPTELQIQSTNYALENARKHKAARGEMDRDEYFNLSLGLSSYKIVSESEFLANLEDD